jgi:O-antigen/teichoic acid export membrane protein
MNNTKRNVNNSKPSLKKNLVYNFISQILTLIIPLFTTPYLSRVLGEEGNGQLSYSLSVITVFLLFASLGFTTYGQREIAKVRDDKEARSKVFWEIILLRVITTTVTYAVFFSLFFTTGFKKCNDLILIYSIEIFSTVFDVTFFYQGEEDFKSLAIRSISIRIATLILIFCLIKSSDDTWIYALCISVLYFFSFLVMWPNLKGKIVFVKLRNLSFKRHILPTFRIFIPQLAITVYSVMDKLMIGWFATNSDYENGCYEQAYKINNIGLLLVTVISSVLAPRNTYDYKNGNTDKFKEHIDFAIHYTWMIGLPLIAGFIVLSKNLSSWYLGDGYDEVPLLLQIMSVRFVASGLSELCGNQIFIPIGKEKYYTIATCAAALSNVVLNYF